MNYTGPKVKLSRRLGIALTPKAAQIMAKRPYPPGQHGRQKHFKDRNPSDYKRQLLEKQKLRLQYNIHERQMRNYFIKASRRRERNRLGTYRWSKKGKCFVKRAKTGRVGAHKRI
ncbi:MAG: hypothetical protein DPW09_32630, partial [Anaerolineae bacterium]|nr:hypothetical protein [Anaerolineae bacterium]